MSKRIIKDLYDIDDYIIIPENITSVKSRSECNCIYNLKDTNSIFNNKYPLITAPMASVINEDNWSAFDKNGIVTIIPRTVQLDIRLSLIHKTFVAFGLDEFAKLLSNPDIFANEPCYVCVDIANGHMDNMISLCSAAKVTYGDNIIILAGNIANPDTYLEYAKAGIDLIRLGIGTGHACITSSNTGVHYPLGTLIDKCSKYKSQVKLDMQVNPNTFYKSVPKIIADGGFDNFDRIIKALALGADFCMVGKLFAKMREACGQMFIASFGYTTTDGTWYPLPTAKRNPNTFFTDTIFIDNIIYREYYGMSTKRAQVEMGKEPETCRTSEGVVRYVKVDTTIPKWLDNFAHYLKSAMSYSNCFDLPSFIGGPLMGISSDRHFSK